MSDPDIVERLRRRTFRPTQDIVQAFNEQGNLTNGDALLHDEAADEITRLRADLATSMETLAKAQALQAEMLKERAALAQPAAPEWQWVPVEPTPEMVEAMARAWQQAVESDDPNECVAEWRAAIAAAPQAPQPGGQGA